MRTLLRTLLVCGLAALVAWPALADEAKLRKNLAERVPKLPAIDEVNKTQVPGLYEIRMGSEVMYSDEEGDTLIMGSLFDTRTRTDITEARLTKLAAIDFDKLPFKDAVMWKSGNGARRIAVFADPNCGYCKHLEQDLQKIKNVTVYTFIIPILGGDSPELSRNIWCAKEPSKAWLGWMLDGKAPPRSMGACDTPLQRNLALSRKHRVNGTPALVFADGTRVGGVMTADQIEKQLVASATKP